MLSNLSETNLKKLTIVVYIVVVLSDGHDSKEDAEVTMKLASRII